MQEPNKILETQSAKTFSERFALIPTLGGWSTTKSRLREIDC
jgi:hypothetical protein